MTTVKVPPEVTREELEAAFPWVRYLPGEAVRQFAAYVDSYRMAAVIYSDPEVMKRATPPLDDGGDMPGSRS
jgi:hypothetical protein